MSLAQGHNEQHSTPGVFMSSLNIVLSCVVNEKNIYLQREAHLMKHVKDILMHLRM